MLLGRQLNRPVVIAMVAVRMMEVAVNQIVGVFTMRHGGMAAIGTVDVVFGVFSRVIGRESVGVERSDSDDMVVVVTVVKIV